MGKRILHLPKSTANNVVRLALKWPSIRARVLCIKLIFLLKTMNSTDSLSYRVFCSLAIDDVEALQLIRQSCLLESTFNTNLTSKILSSSDTLLGVQIKKEILDNDWSLLLTESSTHPSQSLVHRIATSPQCSWPKIWDHALDNGVPGTSCTQALLRLLSFHPYSDNVCPVQGCSSSVNSESISAHFLAEHTSLDITIEHCVDCLINCSDDILTY